MCISLKIKLGRYRSIKCLRAHERCFMRRKLETEDQREIVDYNFIIFLWLPCRRCSMYTRVTLLAWLITGLRAFENAAMPFRIRPARVAFVHPCGGRTFSSLLLPVAACRCTMWSIEIRSSVPFSYGCTCNRCAICASVLSPHYRISYLSFHLRRRRDEVCN